MRDPVSVPIKYPYVSRGTPPCQGTETPYLISATLFLISATLGTETPYFDPYSTWKESFA